MSAQPPQQPVFNIEKIYVRDLSVELPNAPQIFLGGEAPKLEVQLGNASSKLNDMLYNVEISVTVTAKSGDKTAFLVEAVQAGIFRIQGIPDADLPAVLGIVCPNVLFPYARETVSDVVNRAGFPPVLLAPVNFEALYQQQVQQAAQSGGPRIEIAH
jgi:preprotein translocase subunit SecB